jgi:hypothetical protein
MILYDLINLFVPHFSSSEKWVDDHNNSDIAEMFEGLNELIFMK